MAMVMMDNVAFLEEICAVEEAEALLDWLRQTVTPQVDLSRCEHVHTSVLQTLLAVRPAIVGVPLDPLMVRLLGSAGLFPTPILNGAT